MINKAFSILLFIVILAITVYALSKFDHRALLSDSLPVSHDNGANGLMQLKQFLSLNDIQVQALRVDYTNLSGTGNSLMVMLPATTPPSKNELTELSDWVSAGNHLIVFMAMYDRPTWHNKLNQSTVDRFLSEFNLKLSVLATDTVAPNAEDNPRETSILANHLQHPLTAGVQNLSVETANRQGPLQLASNTGAIGSLILLRDRKNSDPVSWHLTYGKGDITLFAYASLLTNAQLRNQPNMQLATNLFLTPGHSDSKVFFDDIHHQPEPTVMDRFSSYTQPGLLLVYTLCLLGLTYLILRMVLFIYGSLTRKTKPDLEFELLSKGRKSLKSMPKSKIPGAFSEIWFNEIRHRFHLPLNGKPVWSVIENHVTNRRLLRKSVKTWMRIGLNKPIRSGKYITRLEKMRTNLL